MQIQNTISTWLVRSVNSEVERNAVCDHCMSGRSRVFKINFGIVFKSGRSNDEISEFLNALFVVIGYEPQRGYVWPRGHLWLNLAAFALQC